MKKINGLAIALAVSLGCAGAAVAKLPAAPEASKQQAEEAKAKAAWTDQVNAYKLCQVQDRVAETYRKDAKAAGKPAPTPTPVSTASCKDPGPFTTHAHQKPLEASEAHSPPGNATSPPSTKATAAELQGTKKSQ